MTPPPTYPNGACVACLNHLPRCDYHQAEEVAREKRARENLAHFVEARRERDLAGICLQYELESDEGGTRWEKAARIMSRSNR